MIIYEVCEPGIEILHVAIMLSLPNLCANETASMSQDAVMELPSKT